MARKAPPNPLALLRDIERRSRERAAGLPQQVEVKEEWSGIGFRIGELRMLAPLGQVTELLTFPRMSRVPNAKNWVLGIANIRGNLLPVMDLCGFLLGKRTAVHKRSRILVINHGGVFAGLLVDEVLGLKHLPEESRCRELPRLELSVMPYLERAYRAGDETWVVFSMSKLAESPLFLQVAV